jgi:hypothetical protein
MIGESVPDQHKQTIAQLSAQIDHYLATGKRIQPIESGVSGEHFQFSKSTGHRDKLRAARDAKAPRVSELAAQGLSYSAIGAAMGVDSRSIKRVAAENDIAVTGT